MVLIQNVFVSSSFDLYDVDKCQTHREIYLSPSLPKKAKKKKNAKTARFGS